MWPLHREELLERAATRNGEPIAKFQKQSSKTPQRIDNVEACRTISTGLYSGMQTLKAGGLSVSQKAIR
jgi:hypothetical protein